MFNRSITQRGHEILKDYIQKGDVVVDCTAGHGSDTLFLTEWAGENGIVHAFEIQDTAVQELQKKFGSMPQVQIHPVSNVAMPEYVSQASVIMYNLGYLPGGNKKITTQTQDTIRSLEGACGILLPGGVISVVTYPGHPEGKEEAKAVREFLQALPSAEYEVLTLIQSNRSDKTPVQHFLYRIR